MLWRLEDVGIEQTQIGPRIERPHFDERLQKARTPGSSAAARMVDCTRTAASRCRRTVAVAPIPPRAALPARSGRNPPAACKEEVKAVAIEAIRDGFAQAMMRYLQDDLLGAVEINGKRLSGRGDGKESEGRRKNEIVNLFEVTNASEFSVWYARAFNVTLGSCSPRYFYCSPADAGDSRAGKRILVIRGR